MQYILTMKGIGTMKRINLMLLFGLLVIGLINCSGDNGSGSNYPRFQGDDNEIIQFSLPASKNGDIPADVSGTVSGDTISLVVPHSVVRTSLVAEFVTNSNRVEVNGILQESGVTPNDFSNPVVYNVFAENGEMRTYTVDVSPAPSSEKRILSFSLNGTAGTIDEASSTIRVELPPRTQLTSLVASFAAVCASVMVNDEIQKSGVTANDFSHPVVYAITADDNSSRTYTVTATVRPSAEKEITSFSFRRASNPGLAADSIGTIDNGMITVVLPHGSSTAELVASFETTGEKVMIAGTEQDSGETSNDFTEPVFYRVIAEDGREREYTVSVTVAKSDAKAITAFELDGEAGTIDEQGGTITVSLPASKDITRLIASFVATGVLVTVNGTEQESGVTINDFSSSMVYEVTAEDGSTRAYSVAVEKPDDLVGIWNFEYLPDDGSTIFGAQTVEGMLGSALLFDGYDDYLLIPDSDALTLAEAGSIEVVVNIISHRPYAGIVHKGVKKNFSDESYSLQFWGTDGTLRFSIFNRTGAYEYIDSSVTLSKDTWYHLVATWDSSQLCLYINGALDGSVTNTIGTVRDSAGGLVIGAQLTDKWYSSSWHNLGMNGIIDRVELLNRPLSADEVASRYNEIFSGSTTSLSAYLLDAASRNGTPLIVLLGVVVLVLVAFYVYNRRRAQKAG